MITSPGFILAILLEVIALFVGLMHVYIFWLESISWGSKRTNKAFGVSEADAETVRLFAFNQGFYNLFLAIAILVGLALVHTGHPSVGRPWVDYGILSVMGAGFVLCFSAPNLRRAGLMQALPAVAYLVLRAFFSFAFTVMM